MKPTQDLGFWRKRLAESRTPLEAIGVGFNWPHIDRIHREYIKKHMKPTDKILDVSCGIGRTAGWFFDNNYVGIDFVPEFIAEAKKKHPHKRFEVMDITKPLPFNNKEFDWALLISVKVVIAPVIGYDKWDEVEKELKRVAKKVMILEYGDSQKENIDNAFEIL